MRGFGDPLGTIGASDFKTCPALGYQKGAHQKFQFGNQMKLCYLVLANGCLYVYNKDTAASYRKVISTKDIYRLKHENPTCGLAKGMTCIAMIMKSEDSTTMKESKQWLMTVNDENDRMDWMRHLFQSLLKAHGIDIAVVDIKMDYEYLEQPAKEMKLIEKSENDYEEPVMRYTPFEKIIHPERGDKENDGVPQRRKPHIQKLPAVSYAAASGGDVHIYYNIKATNVQVSHGRDGINAIGNGPPAVRLSNCSDSTTDEETLSISSSDEEKRSKHTTVNSLPDRPKLPPQKCMMPRNLVEELKTKQRETRSINTKQREAQSITNQEEAQSNTKQREAQSRKTEKRMDQVSGNCTSGRIASTDTEVIYRKQPPNSREMATYENTNEKEREKRKALFIRQTIEEDYMFHEANHQMGRDLLQDKPVTTFLIRESTEPGKKTLHVKLDSNKTKLKILQSEDGRFYLYKDQQFNSLNELVLHYQSHQIKAIGSCLGLGFRQT